jgi:hypothetical protein
MSKAYARLLVALATKSGTLVRPINCSKCGEPRWMPAP